ncbi:hypothetical protein LDENG_00211770 [Lucifuga dentata]|nr:hypothetical protein LDENG_00211770 [Lucifuga dentata]
MEIFLHLPEMDICKKIPILIFLIINTNGVSGLDIPKPETLVVHIQDGEVIAVWNPPVDAPSKSRYNVQMAKYGTEWRMVAGCTSITVTYCDLTNLIYDYGVVYKVRVQLEMGDDVSEWIAVKRFYPNDSELQPPSFTLMVTSSTLTVQVLPKPILRKLFPYGVTYTIYLEERGQDKKNTTAYLRNDVGEDQRTKTFDSLHWGREYCISVMVEGNGALSTSGVSPKQCLLLPEQEWFNIAVSSLSALGVLAVVAVLLIIIFLYLRRPEKTPLVLKSSKTSWAPLSVEEGLMEVVTDKGWFLAISRPEVKSCVSKQPVLPQGMVTIDNGQENKRTSMDSGVGMESNRRSCPLRQEDSGCGSMGGSEISTSCNSQTEEHLPLDGMTDVMTTRKREDSGVGLSCQLDCSMNVGVQDSEPLKESDGGGNYRSQSLSSVRTEVCDSAEVFKQILPDSLLANVVTGYRAGHHSCICSGAGQCTWCYKRDHYGTEEIRQNRTPCVENGPENSKNNVVDSYKEKHEFPILSRKTHIQMETVRMDDSETSPQMSFLQLDEDFPLLKALSSLPLVEGGHDFSMNNLALSVT